MKTLSIYFAWSLLMIQSSVAQSSVLFANDATSLLRLPGDVTAPGLPTSASGGTYRVELLYAPVGTSNSDFSSAAFQLGGFVEIGTAPGRFNGGMRTAPIPPGSAGRFQVRAWDSAVAATYDLQVAAGRGNLGASSILEAIS
jgi:hypothetical protein